MAFVACLVAAVLLQEGTAQRIPEPDAEAQKQAAKAIKDLFKEEFARKSPPDQVELARKLIKTSADSSVDMSTKYVCLTEARDLAIAASEASVAMEAVSLLGKSFLIAVPAAKMNVLGKMAAATKEVERLRALGRGYYELARETITTEDYDTAGAAATKSETLARAIKDTFLGEQVAELKRDLGILKSEQQKVKASIDNPAAGDADAVGRYLCFVRNEWVSGLKLLSENGKPPLKELAAKDLAEPETPEARVEVGDGWWLQAQTEKISWKKLNLLGRARRWYDLALPAAGGLVKVKLDKRLIELEGLVPGPVNLMRLIDPKRDAVTGEWSMDAGVLSNKGDNGVVLQIPYQPPEEYDLHVVVRRLGSTDSVWTGLVIGNTQVAFVCDGYPASNWVTGFEQVDGKFIDQQPGSLKGQRYIDGGKDATFDFAVRKTSITVQVDGKRLLAYEGPISRLSNRPDVKTPDKKALYLGSWGGKNGYVEVKLTPLSGPGKKTK
ncbi:MAG TPA: hypothetical protein VKU80_03105 [Planctomycetota bacterium]|nr:hypothetical protein [Planctomycetota bacterium]